MCFLIGLSRCSGFIVIVLTLGLGSPGLSPGREHCLVFLGKTLSQYFSTPRCIMGTGELNVGGDSAMD